MQNLRLVAGAAGEALQLALVAGAAVYATRKLSDYMKGGQRLKAATKNSPPLPDIWQAFLREDAVVAATGGAAVVLGAALVLRGHSARRRRLARKRQLLERRAGQQGAAAAEAAPPYLCRICHEEDSLRALIQPCECRGTQARPFAVSIRQFFRVTTATR